MEKPINTDKIKTLIWFNPRMYSSALMIVTGAKCSIYTGYDNSTNHFKIALFDLIYRVEIDIKKIIHVIVFICFRALFRIIMIGLNSAYLNISYIKLFT